MTSSNIPTGRTKTTEFLAPLTPREPTTSAWPTRVEFGIAAGFFLILLGLRYFYVTGQPWDSDEPQHLHVVWAWANGLLPYKDVFDNHSPLFQAMSAPLFGLLGERVDIVTIMRWAITPFSALILVLTYHIGLRLFSARVALWGTLLAAQFPDLYSQLVEYRPDIFWGAMWLSALAILIGGKPQPRRLFAAGFAFGVAFATSMKTVFLIITVLATGVVVWLLRFMIPGETSAREKSWCHLIKCFLAAVAGALIIPLVVIAFFAWKGGLGQMYYCVITHNIVSEGNPWRMVLQRSHDIRFWLFIPMILGGLWLVKRDDDRDRALRRLFFLSVIGLFCPLLFSLWPLVSKQDFIPFFPIVTLVLSYPVVRLGEWLRSKCGTPALLLPAFLASVELIWMVSSRPPWKPANQRNVAIISDALKLTNPGETVFDAKGQTIFRPRPYYYVFEQITREKVERNQLQDDAPKRLITARTPVAVPSYWLTPATARFIDQNYVSVGSVLVLGKKLIPSASRHIQFEIVIPEKYTIIGKDGPISGTLDNIELSGPRDLSAGEHDLAVDAPVNSIAVIWSRAIQKGYTPFEQAERRR
jgi:hypothetical protein